MPAVNSIKYKKITITHRFKSNQVQKNQELKQTILKELIEQEFENVDFSNSINKNITMGNHLFNNYQVKFLEADIKKHLPKLIKLDNQRK